MATKAKPKEIAPKVSYQCSECDEIFSRKATEPVPQSCSCCHAVNPVFTEVTT